MRRYGDQRAETAQNKRFAGVRIAETVKQRHSAFKIASRVKHGQYGKNY